MFTVLGLGIAGVSLAAADAAPAAADATPHQIYEAAQSGHMAEAQQMIEQVLRDHPQNAKAHYIAAQLDARIGDLGAARQQLATAKQLDPSQSFTANRAELGTLERQLAGIRTVMPGSRPFAPAVRRSSAPWGLIIVVGLGALILFNIFRNRAQRAYLPGGGSGLLPPGNPGMQPGYGYPPYPPAGGGSGLMGGLASGLAIGAGVAAGEELVRHMIDGNSSGNAVPPGADFRDEPQNQDMGGADFGTQDGSSWGNDSGGGDAGGWGGDSGGGGGDWS
ncbi:MAG TPA: tetratricopeptide repeat protein [Steroidobacteraceae bacterium]